MDGMSLSLTFLLSHLIHEKKIHNQDIKPFFHHYYLASLRYNSFKIPFLRAVPSEGCVNVIAVLGLCVSMMSIVLLAELIYCCPI